MTRTCTLLLSTAIALSTSAQNWTVGVPVDMLLYTQPFYGGCTPNVDYTFTFPASPVSGVDYKLVITAMEPENGTVSISPGLDNGGLNDGMLFDTEVQRSVTFASGTTSAVFEFRAQGIPTQEGQSHPCSASPFWISNLMFCPEGLIPNVNDGCTVQAGATAVHSHTMSEAAIQWPQASNGWRLGVSLPASERAQARILDASGRAVRDQSITSGSALDLSPFADGTYVLQLMRSSGALLTERFALTH